MSSIKGDRYINEYLLEMAKKAKDKDKKSKDKSEKKSEKKSKDKSDSKKSKDKSEKKGDWWDKMSEEEQVEYLIQHPESEKVKGNLQEKIKGLSDDQKKEAGDNLARITSNPDKALKDLGGEIKLDKKQAKQFDAHIVEFNKHLKVASDKTADKKVRKKSGKLATAAILGAAGVLLGAAGVATLVVAAASGVNPGIAISTILLLREAKSYIPSILDKGKEGIKTAKDLTDVVKETLSSQLEDKEAVKKALV